MYYTADSYKDYTWTEEKAYEKSGKLYVKATCKCDRCVKGMYITRVENGQPVPHPMYGGVCLKCGGSGYLAKEIRLYTEKEKTAMDKVAAAKKQKAMEEVEKKIQADREASEENKQKWFAANGVSADGIVYCIIGDTYAIKEELKQKGCHYNPVLKWYSPAEFELPEGYSFLPLAFDDLYDWSPYTKLAYMKEGAKTVVEKAIAEVQGPSKSEYIGTPGDKLKNITAIYFSSRAFEGIYGLSFIHVFHQGDNVLTWTTSKELTLEKGAVVDLSATIKGHIEYKGVKNTQLTRATVKEIK